MPSAPLLDRMELLGNEQIMSNDSILRTNYEGFGEVRQAKAATAGAVVYSSAIKIKA